MKCDKCKKNEAEIHFTQVKDGKVISHNLCKECAKKYGVKSVKFDSEEQPVFAPEEKDKVLDELLEAKGSKVPDRCPSCNSTLDDIKSTGRLGCGRCYFTFDKQIDVLLRRIQGSSFHLGKSSTKPDDRVYSDQLKIRELKKKLNDAVRSEDYETAASLRDEIITIEKRLKVSG
ncbi:MAG: UvrB/UvrC motif-containing protein [Gemmatimonadota bacterium]|nr:UvrB/UvrC motif-containing protein [Gemmatimonadota bacterium]